ncbi:MAG: sulfatase [Phycisphaerae bacterium]
MRVRLALAQAVLLLAQPLGAEPAAGTRPARQRPNVVLLVADQWRAQALGFAGDVNARTPHLDRLAEHGTVLTSAVSTCPVCSPYRASLMTGRYPLRHGVFVNDVPLNTEAVSLAQAFSAAGYRTAFIGKWHIDGRGRSSYVPPERRQGFEFWRGCECTHEYNRSPYYADTSEKKYWPGYDAQAQTEEAVGYIRAHQGEPFLLVLAWGPPHNPYQTAPERYRRLFRPEEIVLRPNVPPEAAAGARRDLAGYYAHCAALDDCVGRIVGALEETGLADDTILVFTSDHGDMLGSHAQERKQRPWDESVLVPFLVFWPGGLGRTGRKLTAGFGTPDIMPTLLGLAGVAVPATVDGEDRSAWLRGRQPDDERPALICCITPFSEWARTRGGREYRGVRTSRYTYVRTLDGPWLLYDNREDPYQQRNLVGRAEHAAMQAILERALQRELGRMKDEFLPGRVYLDKWGYRTDASGAVPYDP